MPWDIEQILREIRRHSVCQDCHADSHGEYCHSCSSTLLAVRTWPYDVPPDVWYDKENTHGRIYIGGMYPKGIFERVEVAA